MASDDRPLGQVRDTSAGQTTTRSIRSLIGDLGKGVSTLARQELRLAQAEGSEKMSRAVTGVIAIFGGLLVALCALLLLLQAVVIALAEHMPASVASLIVGIVVAAIAFLIVWQGRRNLSAERLTPQRTVRSLREDSQMVMEKAR